MVNRLLSSAESTPGLTLLTELADRGKHGVEGVWAKGQKGSPRGGHSPGKAWRQEAACSVEL